MQRNTAPSPAQDKAGRGAPGSHQNRPSPAPARTGAGRGNQVVMPSRNGPSSPSPATGAGPVTQLANPIRTFQVQSHSSGRANFANRNSRGDTLGMSPDWKNWSDLRVQLHGLPARTQTLDLFTALRKHGHVKFVTLVQNDTWKGPEFTGKANVTFSPPPDKAIWASGFFPVIIHVEPLQEKRYRITLNGHSRSYTITSPVSPNVRYPEEKIMRPQSLDFGFMSQVATMDIMMTVSDQRFNQMRVDLKRKLIDIAFATKIPYPLGGEKKSVSQEYQIRIKFSHITRVYRVNEGNGWSLIIPLESPPAFYRRRRNLFDSHEPEATRWGEMETWQRTDEITYDSELSKHERVGLKRPYQFIDIGRWTVYKLNFRQNESDNNDWRTVGNALRDFNIEVVVTTRDSFTCQPGKPSTLWEMLDGDIHATANDHLALLHDTVYLPFDLRYQLEAAISQGIFREQSITTEFLKKLKQLYDERTRFINKAINILEYVTDAGKKVYDPMSIFEDKIALTQYSNINLPEHCAWVRKVTVTPSTVYLSSPSVETTNRVLRQYNNNADRFIRVQFTDERIEGRMSAVPTSDRNDALFRRVYRALQNGIQIGDRHYQFLAFGNSQFRENGAYFFFPTDVQTCDNIRDWMGDFRHIKVVAKYAARLGQCFSTTVAPRGIAIGQSIVEIPDIESNGFCFSDGVGKISPQLAGMIAIKLTLKNKLTPSAFQFRLGGNKGIVVTWPDAKFNELHLRPSQKKFNALARNIEIIKQSRFSVATLNRQTINILSCLGVPDEVFIDLCQRQLTDYKLAMTDTETALRLLSRFVDENGTTTLIARMIMDGFMASREPFVLAILQLWRVWSMKFLREKARIVVENGAHLFGCVDETHTLRGYTKASQEKPKTDRSCLPQVFLQIPDLSNPSAYRVIEGLCVVGRNPSLHPGDLRVVEAVDVPALRHLKDVVVFPAKGDQDIPSMCSGGDLDGDEFFVLFDQKLIPDDSQWDQPPMIHDAVRADELDRDVQVKDIIKFFVAYMKNDNLGHIANSHLALCDYLEAGPHAPRCLKLAQLHSDAVDYVKTGKVARMTSKLRAQKSPHFMEKDANKSYRSTRILGHLYDLVTAIDFAPKYDNPFDQRILRRYDLSDEVLGKARAIKTQYDSAMRRIMNQREIKTEFEVWSTFVLSKPRVGTDYKVQEDMGFVMAGLRDRFLDGCLEAADAKADRSPQKVLPFVAAMYRVTWEEVQIALQECKETRLIGGRMVPKRQANQMPFISFPWLFDTDLGRIAKTSDEASLELDKVPYPMIVNVGRAGQNVASVDNGKVYHRGEELFVVPDEVEEEDDDDDYEDGEENEGDGGDEGEEEDVEASELEQPKGPAEDFTSLYRDDIKSAIEIAKAKAEALAKAKQDLPVQEQQETEKEGEVADEGEEEAVELEEDMDDDDGLAAWAR